MNIYNQIKQIIIVIVKQNFDMINENTLASITCEQPKNLKFGDISSNVLMVIKNKNIDGKKLENIIIKKLLEKQMFENISYKKPGFLNFKLKKDIWNKIFNNIIEDDNFGYSNIGKGKKINLEFVSANPTGPLHVGHLRGAVFGDVLGRLLERNGYKITKEYYVNDMGNQINNLFQTVMLHIENILSNKEKSLSKDMYQGKYLKDIALQLIEEDEHKKNSSIVKESIVKKVLKIIKDDLESLSIKFDNFISEKEIHNKGLLDKSLKILNEKNLLYLGILEKPKGIESEDWEAKEQLLFKSSFFEDTSDRPVKKNDGSWTYFSSDIAYHHGKVLRGYDEIINVWGADHAGYIKRVKAALVALGHTDVKFAVKLCQIVNLLENNQIVKMSKRSGNFILIKDVVKTLGKDVVRFFMLTRKNDAHLDFDLKKCQEENKDNPIFYIQYAIARVNSLNKQLKEKKINLIDKHENGFKRFNEEEINIIKILSLWPKIIENSVTFKEPHRIVYYLIELASILHNYWSMGNSKTNLRIINQNDIELTCARVNLIKCIYKLIKMGLDIISIKPMEKM